MQGVWAGFACLMNDYSTLAFEDNIAEVREMVKIAYALGLSLEAEPGHVRIGENYSKDGYSSLTQVDAAIAYVKQRGRRLAVAIGTTHGVYKGETHINFNLLHELDAKLPVLLALHGGSGTGEENLRRRAREGISKIDLSNDLKRAAVNALTGKDLRGLGVDNLYWLLEDGYSMKLFRCAEKRIKIIMGREDKNSDMYSVR